MLGGHVITTIQYDLRASRHDLCRRAEASAQQILNFTRTHVTGNVFMLYTPTSRRVRTSAADSQLDRMQPPAATENRWFLASLSQYSNSEGRQCFSWHRMVESLKV